ncbi:hypothetical protein F4861DRAFT_511840 [Xylaria intraflava]|nr:hypothetical protein F4861DRAFT_511840 [Xylaria intraflava]
MMDSSSIGSNSSSSKLAAVKRFPKILSGKGRRKKSPTDESFGSLASTENEEHPRAEHRPGTRKGDGASEPGSPSTAQSNDLTEDVGRMEGVEDQEDPFAQNPEHESRPVVPSTHPSQIGYLTTSSPIIQSNHIPVVQTLDQQETREKLSRFATSDQLHLPTYTPSNSKTDISTSFDSPLRRSRSPAGRVNSTLRGASSTGTEVTNNSRKDDSSGQEVSARPSSRPHSAVSSHSNANEFFRPDAEESRQARRIPFDTSVHPRTPPLSGSAAPVIVNTPPTPVDSYPPRNIFSPVADSDVAVAPPGNMKSQRRPRSGSQMSISPSKLANVVSVPLTPASEDLVPSTPGAGFFSSVFSAAQNAANTLSSTITNTGISAAGNRPKSNTSKEKQFTDDERVEVESPLGETNDSNMGGKEPAVKTLGMGDLSLSQLGFQEAASTAPTPTTSKFNGSVTESRARSESAPVDSETAPANGDGPSEDLNADRPRSLYEYTNTTPPASIYEDGIGVNRTSSIRSAISKTKRRKRGSTEGTTGTATTIGAAIAAANASVAHPTAAGSAPKLTGFAVASKKRNRDFHALFKSVPDDDYLIEDYSCALQREILAHGRLYVSEGHLCFSSNILGWVTTLVMSFDEIVSVEKRSTALLFKNGLMISTLHAKHVFASFTSRDSTYDLIVNIWKLGHPTLRSSLNGVSIDETGGDKTEKVDVGEDAPGSQSGSGSEDDDSDDEIYDEDLEDEEIPEEPQPVEPGLTETDGEKVLVKKLSGAATLNGGAVDKSDTTPPSSGGDFPGPVTHGPTECGDSDAHFEVPIGDDIVAAPLGKVYNHMFGPASVAWMSKWLLNEQKCTDLQMEDKVGLTQDNKSRIYSYIKPLYASLGPKQTKCIVTETIEHVDFEKAVNILVITQTPDVPSGNLFVVKTKYCLFWAENNSTHVTINCTIEWSGKSWLKGAIEKGAKDGQAQYWKDLFASLKPIVSTRARSTTLNGTARGKKKKTKSKLNEASKDALRGPADSKSPQVQGWGLFEPLHGILGPIFDIIKPVITGNVVYGLLVGLLVATWFGFGFNSQPRGIGYGDIAFSGYPVRAIAYDELWSREEGDLWDWLEERVGLYRMNEGAVPIRKRVTEPRTMEAKLQEERMTEREVKEAIRITEEKLDILRSIVNRKTDIPRGEFEANSG